MQSAMGYFRVHWRLSWQKKYPHIKTRKKLSEKLLCYVWIHLTELYCFFSLRRLLTMLSWNLQRVIWECVETYGEKQNILRPKLEKAFWETLWCVDSSHRLTLFFSLSSLVALFLGNLQRDFSELIEVYGEKGNILS